MYGLPPTARSVLSRAELYLLFNCYVRTTVPEQTSLNQDLFDLCGNNIHIMGLGAQSC